MKTIRITALLILLGGCATIHRHEAASTEQLLAAAGFQMRPTDTAERASELSTMPPLKIVARTQDSEARYTFADPYNCRCLYVGGPKEYATYQRLAVEKQAVQDQLWAEEDAMDWALWGPWYWR
jgi:uncharacterized protein YceK